MVAYIPDVLNFENEDTFFNSMSALTPFALCRGPKKSLQNSIQLRTFDFFILLTLNHDMSINT